MVLFAFRSERQIKAGLSDEAAMQKAKPGLLATSKKHFEENHNDLEKEIMVEMLKLYKKNVLADQLPEFFALIDSKYKGMLLSSLISFSKVLFMLRQKSSKPF